MSIEYRIDLLKKDLLNPAGPCISTNRNYPFALFQYPPHEEFKMKSSLIELLDTLRTKGWTILNVDLLAALIDYLDGQEDGEFIESIIAEEKLQYKASRNDYSMPLKVLQNSLAVIFDIGSAAQNNESTPHTIYRRVMQKLGYSHHDGVAYYVDEVSQYIARDQNKMLDLQSFVSEIGGRVKKGRSPLWLLVTGQEKLEEESKDSVLFKLKDRFPPELQVHLDRANVKEVVSRRLLKKKGGSELETLVTDAVLDSLKLYGYECAGVTKDQVIEHYPLLPGHIGLFMDITQCICNRSSRTQSDAGGVRSVLNNIWDLFNRDP